MLSPIFKMVICFLIVCQFALGIVLAFEEGDVSEHVKNEIKTHFSKGVVKIVVSAMSDYRKEGIEWGSGFLINSNGYILTNYHVIKPKIEGDRNKRTFFFTESDLVNPKELMKKLMKGEEKVSKFLFENLDEELKTLLNNQKIFEDRDPRLLRYLLKELNKALKNESLSSPEIFPEKNIPNHFKEFLKKKPLYGQELYIFNRGLLESAYRDNVATWKNFEVDVYKVLNGGQVSNPIPAIIVKFNKELDVALLKIPGSRHNALPLGNSNSVGELDYVVVIGFPLGGDKASSIGEIAGMDRINGFLETRAEIYPGNSGGPALSVKDGTVVGIAVGGKEDFPGMNYLIPINHANNLISIAGISPAREEIRKFVKQIKENSKKPETLSDNFHNKIRSIKEEQDSLHRQLEKLRTSNNQMDNEKYQPLQKKMNKMEEDLNDYVEKQVLHDFIFKHLGHHLVWENIEKILQEYEKKTKEEYIDEPFPKKHQYSHLK